MKIPYQGLLVALSAILVLFILSPLELSFVVSGSMTPVIQPNSDMFIIDKSSDTVDEYSEGDIITFYSPTNERLTTHRVIDIEDDGLITQGDDAFQTDQERGDPPIDDELIRGKGIMFNGELLTIPNSAPLAIFFNEHTIKILFSLLLMLVVNEFVVSGRKRRKRRKITPLKIMLFVSLFLILLWSGAIYVSAITVSGSNIVVTEQTELDSSEFAETDKLINRTQTINIDSSIPTYDQYRLLNENMEITSLERKESETVINFEAGPYDQRTVKNPVFNVYTYPKTLPAGTITFLHNIHPLLASLGTLSVIAIPINLLILVTVNNTRIRTTRIRAIREIDFFGNDRDK